MVQAFTDAFLTCDADFTASSKKSGSTAVCALIRDDTIYIAWLGDSTASLVREGVTVKVMDSHKPDRPDERARVEGLGGTVIHWGAWRVNGQLAVSRFNKWCWSLSPDFAGEQSHWGWRVQALCDRPT